MTIEIEAGASQTQSNMKSVERILFSYVLTFFRIISAK